MMYNDFPQKENEDIKYAGKVVSKEPMMSMIK